MDRDNGEADSQKRRRQPGIADLVLFDIIPGVDIFGLIPDPLPAVFPANLALYKIIVLNIMLKIILIIKFNIMQVTLAYVAAQVPLNVDNEDQEDYGNPFDEEDEDEDEDEDKDEINTHPQEAPNSGAMPASVRAQALTSFDNEEEVHGYSSHEEVDTNSQKFELVQNVTLNYKAEVDPTAQHEAVNHAAVVFRRPKEDQIDVSNTVVQQEEVDPAQEGYASNTSNPSSDRSQATFESVTSLHGAVDVEISEVDPTEAVAAFDLSLLTSSSRTTTLRQDQAAHRAVLAMTSPAASNTNAFPTEAPKSPGVESIKEEVDLPSLALREAVARLPGTDDAHNAISTLEVHVTYKLETTNATAAATNHAEVTTRVQSSLDCIGDHEGTGMASTVRQKEVELVTDPSHESSNSSTAISSLT